MARRRSLGKDDHRESLSETFRNAARRTAAGRRGPSARPDAERRPGPVRRLLPAGPGPPGRVRRDVRLDGTVRTPYRALHDAIAPTAAADLTARSEALDRATPTRALRSRCRPGTHVPLDIVPRVISASEWTAAARHRCSGSRHSRRSWPTCTRYAQIVGRGDPARLVTSCQHFHRAAAASPRPTGCASTWRASTWCATSRAPSGCWRTTCAARPGCPT